MKLNDRLRMIADKIPSCRTLVDVGTDHGYIPIYAVINALCEKALAADIRAGPLKVAFANIKRYGLENSIETRLGNGLEPILASECDVIVIAGMGGSLIRDILLRSNEKAQNASLLLLQPNNAADALRRWLYENGYDIFEEKLTLDAGKLYCLMSVKWTGNAVKKDQFSCYIGEKLFAGNDPLLQSYLLKKLKEIDVIIAGRSKSNPERVRKTAGITGIDTATCIDIRNKLHEHLKN